MLAKPAKSSVRNPVVAVELIELYLGSTLPPPVSEVPAVLSTTTALPENRNPPPNESCGTRTPFIPGWT
jgi:hypothetical protein